MLSFPVKVIVHSLKVRHFEQRVLLFLYNWSLQLKPVRTNVFLDSTDFYCMDRRKEVIQVLKYIFSFSLSMEGYFCDLEWNQASWFSVSPSHMRCHQRQRIKIIIFHIKA